MPEPGRADADRDAETVVAEWLRFKREVDAVRQAMDRLAASETVAWADVAPIAAQLSRICEGMAELEPLADAWRARLAARAGAPRGG